jgi:hypothetical protein
MNLLSPGIEMKDPGKTELQSRTMEDMPEPHFWEAGGSKWELSHILDPNNERPDNWTWNGWSEVAKTLFPRQEIVNGKTQSRWRVSWESFYGPDGQRDRSKPDAIVVKKMRFQLRAGDEAPKYGLYHWVVIETDVPNNDSAEGWKDLLQLACSRATSYNEGVHDVFIICVIGVKYMIFSWDPSNAGMPTRELRMHVNGNDVRFPSKLKPVPEVSPQLPNLKNDGDPDQYLIALSRVWSIDPGQVDESDEAMEPLKAMENFMIHARTVQLDNPYSKDD